MFFFEGNILEEVNKYKYLRIDFNNKLNWEDCRKKTITNFNFLIISNT